MILFDWRNYLKNKLVADFFKYTLIGTIVTLMNIFFTWFLIDIIDVNTVIATTSVVACLHIVKFYSYRISRLFGRRQMGHIQFMAYTAVVVFCSILNIVLVWFLIDILHIGTVISVTAVVVGLFALKFILFKVTHLIEGDVTRKKHLMKIEKPGAIPKHVHNTFYMLKNRWSRLTDKQKNLILALGISISAIIIWLQYGIFKYPILYDHGIYLYGADQLLEGSIPYVNAFAMKTPMSFFVPAGGLLLFSSIMGLSPWLANMITMLILGSGTIFFTYLLTYHLFKDRINAILTVVILLSFTAFVRASLGGIQKLIMIFFAITCFYALIRKKWFAAGLLGSLSALTWQPAAIFPLIVIIYSFADKQQRKEQLKRSLLGVAIPIIAIILFFFLMGGLQDMINQTFFIILTLKESAYWGSPSTINLIIFEIFYRHGTEILFFIFGFLGFIIFTYKERKNLKNLKKPIPFIFFSFVSLTLYSLYDFQNWPDMIPLLPFIAIFASYFLMKLSKKVGHLIQQKAKLPSKKTTVTYTAVIILILSSIYGIYPILRESEPVMTNITNIISERGDTHQIDEMLSHGDLLGASAIIIEDVGLPQFIKMLFFTKKTPDHTLEEQLEVANFIKNNSNSNDSLLFVATPDMCFLSGRKNFGGRHHLFASDLLYMQEAGKLTSFRERVMEEKPPLIIGHSLYWNTTSQNLNPYGFILLDLYTFIDAEYEIIMQSNYYIIFQKR